MLKLKIEFLAIDNYDEFDRNRDKFIGLDGTDKDVAEHYMELLQKKGVKFNLQSPDDTTIKDYF